MICIDCQKPINTTQKNNFVFLNRNYCDAIICEDCYKFITNKLIAIDFSKIIIIKKKALQKYREKQLLLSA